jgi:hypothetical protein
VAKSELPRGVRQGHAATSKRNHFRRLAGVLRCGDPGAMAPSQRLLFDAAHIATALSLSLSDVAALRLMFLMDALAIARFRESRAASHRSRNMATLRAFFGVRLQSPRLAFFTQWHGARRPSKRVSRANRPSCWP